MGLIQFVKDAGKKLFGGDEAAAAVEPAVQSKRAAALEQEVRSLGLPVDDLKIKVADDTAHVKGKVPSQAVRESLALDPWPITARPDNLVLVIAGGGHPTNSYWLAGYSPRVIGRPIDVPDGFDALIAESERELTSS